MEKRNELLEVTLELALEIIEYTEVLEDLRKYVLARQLLKAGTSIGANANEAQSAESRADFIHKLKISDKEARETRYWITLCQKSKNYPNPSERLLQLLLSTEKLLNKILGTARRNK